MSRFTVDLSVSVSISADTEEEAISIARDTVAASMIEQINKEKGIAVNIKTGKIKKLLF